MKKNNSKLVIGGLIAVLGFFLTGYFSDFANFLKTSAVGDPATIQYKGYAYNSEPLNLNYGATNFACGPGPIQTSGTYVGTYNTYYYGYSKVYTNSGVPGSWCQNYSTNLDQTVYTATNPPPANHDLDPFQIRWWDHINAAKKHEAIPVIYEKNYIPNYPKFYMTGGYESTAPTANQYSNLYPLSVVKCPTGARVVDHTTFGSTLSAAHLLNQNTQEGEFDGYGHKWCELNGVAVAPIAGLPDGATMFPDIGGDYKAKLYRFEFPNGIVKYKYYKKHDPLKDANGNNISSDAWVKCAYGIAGTYIYGQNQYYSQYASPTEEEKRPFYRCLRADNANFVEPVADNEAVPSIYSTIGNGYFRYSTPACPASDATCGGANTLGNVMTGCSTGTYWCQSKNQYFRYCSATPDCTGKTDVPLFSYLIKSLSGATPSTAVGAATNLTFETYQKIDNQLLQNIADTVTYQLLKNNAPVSFCTLSTNAQALSGVYDPNQPEGASRGLLTITCNPAAEHVGEHNLVLRGTSPYNQQAGGTAEFSLNIKLIVNSPSCTSLTLVITDNKTAYTQGEFVNYIYSCVPTGTRAPNVTVQVVKPDGSASTYVTGKNIDTSTLGFSTSNLAAGNYFLRVCFDPSCSPTSFVNSLPFTVAASAIPTYICGDGQCNNFETSQSCPADCYAANGTTGASGIGTGSTGFTPSSGASGAGTGLTGFIPSSGASGAGTGSTGFIPSSGASGAGTGSTGFTQNNGSSQSTATQPGSGTTAIIPTNGHPSPMPTPTYPAMSGECAEGKICRDGWCREGKQCYYSDSSFTCVGWQKSCPEGTKKCSPQDKNCIEPGAYGPLDGWCAESNACYPPDGKRKFCQSQEYYGGPMSGIMMMPQMTCPTGFKFCSPQDAKCIEPDSLGPIDGWCHASRECYSPKDTKQKYCQIMKGPATSSYFSGNDSYCTYLDYVNSCSPNDKYCLDIGETSESGESGSGYWCAGNAKQCYLPDGFLYCAGADKECPGGAGVCRKDDVNCIEPGKYGPITGWCGGRNVLSCYKNDGTQTYCAQMAEMNNPLAWEQAACPEGTSRCRAEDKYCLELGETGPPASWCAVGMRQNNADGTITCVKTSDFKREKEVKGKEEQVCKNIVTPGFNSKNNECKNFATSCLPEGFEVLSADKICQEGKILNINDLKNDTALSDIIGQDQQFLKIALKQVSEMPDGLIEAEVLKKLIIEGLTGLGDLEVKLIKNKRDKATITAVQEKLDNFHKKNLTDIKNKLEEIKPYLEFKTLKKDLEAKIEEYKIELEQIDRKSPYAKALSNNLGTLESLFASGENLRGQVLSQLISAINNTKLVLDELVAKERHNQSQDFLTSSVSILNKNLERYRKTIEEKNIEDYKILKLSDKLEFLIEDINSLEDEGILNQSVYLIDEASMLSDKLEIWLKNYGLEEGESLQVQQLLQSHLKEEIVKKIDVMFADYGNKMEIMLDAQMKQIAVKLAEMTDQFNKFSQNFTETIAQSINNLTYVSEKHREIIAKSKENIVGQVEAIEKALSGASIPLFSEQKLRETMELSAEINWCGELAEKVQTEINAAGINLERSEITTEEIIKLEEKVNDMAEKNNEECYKIGASNFRDVSLHTWYFGPTEYNFQKGYIKGYYDAKGNRLGTFGAGDPALRIEALTMFMRLFDIPLGDKDKLIEQVPGTPLWGIPYVNGALRAGVNFDKTRSMDQPISRLETAILILDFVKTVNQKNFRMPTEIVQSIKYPDFENFAMDKEAVAAVEVLTDAGIFKGAGDGNFYPENNLLRSEFATLNQRIEETYGK